MVQNFEKIFVKEEESIKDVMRKIDQSSLGVALVVNENKKLLGLVTDGDIRVAIVKGISITTPIKDVMNRRPITVKKSDNLSVFELIELMRSKAIRHVPVLDDKGKVIDFNFFSEIQDKLIKDSIFEIKRVPAPSEIITKVLVVGGAGYIGSVLVRKLLDKGYKVKVLDSLLYGDESIKELYADPNFEFLKGDTRHIEDVTTAIKDVCAVVHLGEIVGDPACAIDPTKTLEINYLATKIISSVCKHHQINRFIFMSSCSVYGASQNPDDFLDEKSNLNPVSLYAQMKIMSENEILRLMDENFSPTILRLATVFGMSYRPRFDLVVNLLTAKALTEGEITIFGGDQWRPNVHVSDVGDAIIKVLESPIEKVRGQTFNVGSNEENYKIKDMGSILKECVPNVKIVVSDENVDKRNYRVSFDKINKILGFKTKKTVKDGVIEVKEAIEDGKIKDYKEKKYSNYKSFSEYYNTGKGTS